MLDRTGAGPRTAEVMAAIRDRIAARLLSPGARLPSIRRMAETLGVSKSTVVEAYDRLVADGTILSRPGSGFYIAGRPAPLNLAAAAPPTDRAIDPLWIMHQSLESGAGQSLPGCGWLPDDWLPVEAIGRALRRLGRADADPLTGYGPPKGLSALRQQLTRRLADQGIEAPAERIVLTDSGTQAIDLVCRFLVEPGDTVLVDDPCYFNVRAMLRAHRATLVGVPYTPSGPDLAAFAAAAAEHRPRLYITTAALHNPTGASLMPTVAHRLLKLAELHDVTIVEDDIFADFETERTPRLAAFDGLDRVVHIGSFSKTLTAAARCGFIAARSDWIDGLVDLKLATSFANSDVAARLVHALLTDGSYRRHAEGLRTRLAAAMARTARALEAAGLTLWTQPRGGLFLWVALPNGLDSADVARHALTEGVVLAPGNVFSVTQGAARFLRFNVAQAQAPRVFEVLRRAMQAAAV